MNGSYNSDPFYPLYSSAQDTYDQRQTTGR